MGLQEHSARECRTEDQTSQECSTSGGDESACHSCGGDSVEEAGPTEAVLHPVEASSHTESPAAGRGGAGDVQPVEAPIHTGPRALSRGRLSPPTPTLARVSGQSDGERELTLQLPVFGDWAGDGDVGVGGLCGPDPAEAAAPAQAAAWTEVSSKQRRRQQRRHLQTRQTAAQERHSQPALRQHECEDRASADPSEPDQGVEVLDATDGEAAGASDGADLGAEAQRLSDELQAEMREIVEDCEAITSRGMTKQERRRCWQHWQRLQQQVSALGARADLADHEQRMRALLRLRSCAGPGHR